MTRSGLRKLSVSHTQCSPFTNGNAPPTSRFVVLCAPLLCQCGLVRKTESHHGRGSSMQGIAYMTRVGKSRNSKMVMSETTQKLAKEGNCSHPRARRTQERDVSTRGSTLQSRAQKPGCCQSGTIGQVSRLCGLLLSFMPVTLFCHLHGVHQLLIKCLPSPSIAQ